MKIAAITEDGITISQHFGRAPLYLVITVENGKTVSKETRDKTGHHTFAAHQHPEMTSDEPHGYDAGAKSRHTSMAETIIDCQVLLAGGMGMGAYESMQVYNIETIVTDVENIDEAIKQYIGGKLHNLMERLH